MRRDTQPVAALDRDTLEGLRDLGVDAFRELVQLFLREAADRVNGLQAMAACGDDESLAGLAHSLKGSSLGFGALGLAALCADIEEAARHGARPSSRLVEDAAAEFERVRGALTGEVR